MPERRKIGGTPARSAAPSARSTGRGSSPEPSRRSGRGGSKEPERSVPKTTGSGWGAVINRKKQTESKSFKNRPHYLQIAHKFFLTDGESAIIQFLDDEPYAVEGCLIPPDFRDFLTSPKSVGKRHCPMVEDGLKLVWKAGFKLIDYRGEYDKDKKKHKPDSDPVEKYWLVPQTVAMTLKGIADKKGKNLSELVLEVTRHGSDKNTTYSFEIARDEDDRMMKPYDWEEELPSTIETLKPLPESVLNDILGKGDGKEDEDDADIDTD